MKTLLVIDDDESILSLFAMVLQRKGYSVLQAASGEAGLALVKEQRPDLILTDLNMPGTSGLAVLKSIKGDPELGRIPVVIMTGDEAMSGSNKEAESLADGILVKPISMDKLLQCVAARLA